MNLLKRASSLFLTGICLGICFLPFSATPGAGAEQALQVQQGLHLSQSMQQQMGIKTQTPKAYQLSREYESSAKVIDIQELLAYREQYLAALAEQQSALATLSFSEQSLKRAENLFKDGIASQRQLQSQQMQQRSDYAKIEGSRYRLGSLHESIVNRWGETLASWAEKPDHATMSELIKGRKVLLQTNLPPGKQGLEIGSKLLLHAHAERAGASSAQVISTAPATSDLMQGESYFLLSDRGKLRSNMRVTVWLNDQQVERQAGFLLPVTSWLWHAGQACIYLKTAPETFQRLIIERFQTLPDGYFTDQHLPADSQIVTQGAQLLLSQEFRRDIPQEDDGDEE